MSKTLETGKLEKNETANVPMFVLSRNPDKAMQEMMDTLTALRDVYEQENEALLVADTKRFLSLLDKKVQVARDYQAGALQMMQRRDEFKKASPQLRIKLMDEHENFTQLAAVNLEALERMRKSARRLGDRIMGAARDAVRSNSVSYSASGNLGGRDRAVSMGLNESA
jgi:hypothetical protein